MSNPVFDFPLVSAEPQPVGESDQQTESNISLGRKMCLLRFAQGIYLDVIGNNYGVARPWQDAGDDEIYRRIIMVMAWQPKTILFTIYGLMSAVFGTQAQLVNDSKRPWRIYEVNPNEFIVELPSALISTSNVNASYLHGHADYAYVTSGPTDTFTTPGDVTKASATTLVGKNIYVYYSGAWHSFTILAASYNSGTGKSTVQVSAATIPTGGGRFYIEVPGDGTASYRGDYIAAGFFLSSYSTPGGPNTNTLLVIGDATQDVAAGATVIIGVNGALSPRVTSSLSYSNATNVTTVVLTTTDVPGGQVGQVFQQSQEVADTATTPPHDDRIYLSGLGLFDVAKPYLDLIRAAGVIMRVEVI